jgi:hypothetical protein
MFNIVEDLKELLYPRNWGMFLAEVMKASPILVTIYWGLVGRINSLHPHGAGLANQLLAIDLTLLAFSTYKAFGCRLPVSLPRR